MNFNAPIFLLKVDPLTQAVLTRITARKRP